MTHKLMFYIFATISLLSALNVIISRNMVRAVFSLILTFLSTAFIWMLLEAEFLAIALVLVYVGAVMVLFLFVIMTLELHFKDDNLSKIFSSYGILLAIIFAPIAGYWLYTSIGPNVFNLPMKSGLPADYSYIEELGMLLYTKYLIPFEIAGVILLVAIVAAIGLTFRGKQHSKSQLVNEQVLASKANRLKMIDVPFEKD